MSAEHKPHSERDLRVPEITRTWERAAKAMPPSDPTNPDDPSVNLNTLAAIANAKWWQAHDLEEQMESLERGLCDCVTFIYDYPLGVEDKDYSRRRALILAAGSRFASGLEVASSPAASIPAKRPT